MKIVHKLLCVLIILDLFLIFEGDLVLMLLVGVDGPIQKLGNSGWLMISPQ